MPQNPYNSNTDDTQRYESSTSPYIPYTKNTSHSSNVQEDAQSNSQQSEHTEMVQEGVEDSAGSLTLTTLPPPTISIVPISASALSQKKRLPLLLSGSLLLLLIIVAFSTFAISSYINRSTPQKTLDLFCSSLQKQDYKTAYIQFSPNMQQNFTESQFASLFASDKVANCRYGAVGEMSTSTTTSLQLVHHVSGETNNDSVTLIKDAQGQWKIDSLQTTSPIS